MAKCGVVAKENAYANACRRGQWNFAGGHRNGWNESRCGFHKIVHWTPPSPPSQKQQWNQGPSFPWSRAIYMSDLPKNMVYSLYTWDFRAGHRGTGVKRGWTTVVSKHQALLTGRVSQGLFFLLLHLKLRKTSCPLLLHLLLWTWWWDFIKREDDA